MDNGKWVVVARTALTLALGVAVVVALMINRHPAKHESARAESGSNGRSSAAATSSATPGSASPDACAAAVRQANGSLVQATRVEKSLAQHTAVMNQLLAGKISPQQALNMGMPSLIHGAGYSAQFDVALRDYRILVQRCDLAGPNAASKMNDPCRRAVQRANDSFTEAVGVKTALAAHTQVMNQLLAGQITPTEALNQGGISLIQGAAYSSKFDAAHHAYLTVVRQCQLAASAG